MKSQRLYCRHILERIRQIERFTVDGKTAFMADDRTQEAVIRCFEVIGEAVKRLDTTLTAQYEDVSWRGFSGFRDVLIHQYDDIDMEKVWETVRDDLPPLKTAVETCLSLCLMTKARMSNERIHRIRRAASMCRSTRASF